MQVILVPLTWKSASHLREGWRWSRSSAPADAPMLRAWASTGRGTEGRDAPSLRHPRVLWRPGVPQRHSVWDRPCGFTMTLILGRGGGSSSNPLPAPQTAPSPAGVTVPEQHRGPRAAGSAHPPPGYPHGPHGLGSPPGRGARCR